MTWKPDVVIYHSPCDDGFGAAWAVWQLWGDTVEYVPGTYGKPAPDVAGKHVLIVDFSFKRPVLDEMLQVASSIVILDHHKTAQEDLAPFVYSPKRNWHGRRRIPAPVQYQRNVARPRSSRTSTMPRATFDMAKSGARLAWEFCHPDTDVPLLIQLIEDRDLWQFHIPETKAFSLYLRSHAYDFSVWSLISHNLEWCETRKPIFDQAASILKFYDQKIAEAVREVRMTNWEGEDVPTVNCSWAFTSDVAHELLTLYPDAPFAAAYYDAGDGTRRWSLRSDDDREDVSAIAKRLGGGGHRNAAGYQTTLPELATV